MCFLLSENKSIVCVYRVGILIPFCCLILMEMLPGVLCTVNVHVLRVRDDVVSLEPWAEGIDEEVACVAG